MYKVHQMRAGAPDKISLAHHPRVEFMKHDNCNLVDYDQHELESIAYSGEYILPADEGDILHANKLLKSGFINQACILLPQEVLKNGTPVVINYDDFVPKDADIYQLLNNYTDVKYAEFTTVKVREFKAPGNDVQGVAYKTTTGSGSRGVILIDKDRIHLGGKYVAKSSDADWVGFKKFAESQPDCKIMIQQLIPNRPSLTKVNVDFVIRDGELLGYKWDATDPSAVFTNWNWGYFVRNNYTDKIMKQIHYYLTTIYGIKNAIMNFEAFSDMCEETWMVEFNWRYSNSMFEWQALGIDPIYQYLKRESFDDKMPYGNHKFSRYWQCALYENIDDYHSGK